MKETLKAVKHIRLFLKLNDIFTRFISTKANSSENGQVVPSNVIVILVSVSRNFSA